MPTLYIAEVMSNEAFIKYMILPILISACAVLFTSIVTNQVKVSLLQKWVANVDKIRPSDLSYAEVFSNEDEDMQRIANIYKDF